MHPLYILPFWKSFECMGEGTGFDVGQTRWNTKRRRGSEQRFLKAWGPGACHRALVGSRSDVPVGVEGAVPRKQWAI